MNTQEAANIISLAAAIITTTAVCVAIWSIRENRRLAREDRLHTEKLALEDQHYQGRPVLVPVDRILNFALLPNKIEPTHIIPIKNIGNGAAFNVHCVTYYANNIKYSSWNNGPISTDSPPCQIVLDHGSDNINMGMQVSVDGKHNLYNDSDQNYRPGRLTMTYRDLFNIQHVSIFDYIVPAPNEHRWVQLAIKSGIEKDLEDLDNERVPSSRRIKPDH